MGLIVLERRIKDQDANGRLVGITRASKDDMMWDSRCQTCHTSNAIAHDF